MDARPGVLLILAIAASVLTQACDSDPPSGGLFPAGCEGPLAGARLYPNAEVEPSFAVDPSDPAHLMGAWQQDRYSNGGSRGILSNVSFDAGKTWTTASAKFSRCTGGNASNGGNYDRASDPWLSISPGGTAHQLALSFDMSGDFGRRAILASRSTDGGKTWTDPAGLQVDTNPFFTVDKGSITADQNDASKVYAVWDRLTDGTRPNSTTAHGPAWFARSTDGGSTWEAARPIYDPGPNAQTIGNIVAVLPDGTLLNVLQEIACNVIVGCSTRIDIKVLSSTDKGVTWPGPPVTIATVESVGVSKMNEFVRTGGSLPAIAVDASASAVYVAWKDSRFSHARDAIALSTSVDGGRTWSAPVQANRAPAAQAFTPALSAGGGRVAVSYYDTRDDNPNDASAFLAGAFLAVSPDQGTTWQETRLAAPFNLRSAPVAEGYFLGDYQGLGWDRTGFLAFFAAANPGNASDPTSVLFRRVP
jgi:hypothetical protein